MMIILFGVLAYLLVGWIVTRLILKWECSFEPGIIFLCHAAWPFAGLMVGTAAFMDWWDKMERAGLWEMIVRKVYGAK